MPVFRGRWIFDSLKLGPQWWIFGSEGQSGLHSQLQATCHKQASKQTNTRLLIFELSTSGMKYLNYWMAESLCKAHMHLSMLSELLWRIYVCVHMCKDGMYMNTNVYICGVYMYLYVYICVGRVE